MCDIDKPWFYDPRKTKIEKQMDAGTYVPFPESEMVTQAERKMMERDSSSPSERQSAPTGAQNSASEQQAERPLGDAACCASSIDPGLRDTPITASFETWWTGHGDKCETIARELGIKEAVERGFFGGHERSNSTLVRLNPASSSHSAGVL